MATRSKGTTMRTARASRNGTALFLHILLGVRIIPGHIRFGGVIGGSSWPLRALGLHPRSVWRGIHDDARGTVASRPRGVKPKMTGGRFFALATVTLAVSYAELPTSASGSVAPGSRVALVAPAGAGQIAFTSDRSGNSDIYLMNADGSAQTDISNDPGSDPPPAWSPDGTRIAFTSDRSGNSDIYLMNADGSAQTDISNDP